MDEVMGDDTDVGCEVMTADGELVLVGTLWGVSTYRFPALGPSLFVSKVMMGVEPVGLAGAGGEPVGPAGGAGGGRCRDGDVRGTVCRCGMATFSMGCTVTLKQTIHLLINSQIL